MTNFPKGKMYPKNNLSAEKRLELTVSIRSSNSVPDLQDALIKIIDAFIEFDGENVFGDQAIKINALKEYLKFEDM